MPDWSGRYWFVSRLGVIGVVDPATGAVRTMELTDEEIENSMAVVATPCTSCPTVPCTR